MTKAYKMHELSEALRYCAKEGSCLKECPRYGKRVAGFRCASELLEESASELEQVANILSVAEFVRRESKENYG